MYASSPIIRSLLDLDYYKLTMAQIAWKYFREIPVTYAFKNRTTGVRLSERIPLDELMVEVDYARNLKFAKEEISYLRESKYIKAGFFSEDFLGFLENLRLPAPQIIISDGNYQIKVKGSWPETILWETLILSIMNELYYRHLIGDHAAMNDALQEGLSRLNAKIAAIKNHSSLPLLITDFGTRRRFSQEWQEEVVKKMTNELPSQFLGTSNVWLAKKYDLRPIGTFAHEMYMVFSGIYHGNDEEIKSSHNKVLQLWWQEYGESLSTALTDTYGTDFFFRDFTAEQANLWRGFRHDSGDPIEFGEKTIVFYQNHGIDPKTKVIVFSDGLDLPTIFRLNEHFSGRIKVMFGWGTNLTNDCGYPALSLVIKIVESCGYGSVKLSDNLAKAIGKPEDIERFKRIFGHTVTTNEPCKY